MRGFGESGWSAAKDYSLAAAARDIAAVLEKLQWEKAILVGHSMGGRNCAYFAAENPARAAGLVLLDYTPQNAAAGSARVAQSVAGVPESFASIDDALRHFNSTNRARFEAYLKPTSRGFVLKRDTHFRDQFRRTIETGERARLPLDMWEAIGRVACPMLVLRGLRSDLFGPESIERMRAANPRLTLVEVEGGHDIPAENPDAVVREVEAFAAKMEA